jgi:cell wall-associated NlpC family hydrolase
MILMLTGVDAPRDSDQQMAALGEEIAADEELRRGDLVFFPNHVGLMIDKERIVHANSHMMQVAIEPLADTIARFAKTADKPVLARKRLS